jgi:phosphonoacetate hydrolase
LFQRAKAQDVKSALLSCKKKTTNTASLGADLVLAAETPTKDWVERLGPAPDIYSREINDRLLRAAIDLLKNRRDPGCIYIHTTDYPMHTWSPEAPESCGHLARLDRLFAEAAVAAPDAAFLLTADHGMNHKTRCSDLEKACSGRGNPIRIGFRSIGTNTSSTIEAMEVWPGVLQQSKTDRCCYQNALQPGGRRSSPDEESSSEALSLNGFKDRPSDRLGDRDTVFGELDSEFEQLPPNYRAHDSPHEMDVPLLIYNAQAKLTAESFQYNWELARWLYVGSP